MTVPSSAFEGPIVDPAWVEAHLDDPAVRIIDATVILDPESWVANSGRAAFDDAHIPGSTFADLIEELSDPSGDADTPEGVYAYKLPSPDAFARAISRHGVSAGTAVVAYDRAGGMWAARLWWLLRVFGHDDVAVLDGGWDRWVREGRPTTGAPTSPVEATEPFVARFRPELLATADQVRDAIDRADTVLVNALSPEVFRGEVSPLDRAGRIPGSVNVPFFDTLDADGNLRPADELRALFADAGATDEAEQVITYCGGGIAASLDALALAAVGVRAAVYDGSLAEWAADPERPLVVGQP